MGRSLRAEDPALLDPPPVPARSAGRGRSRIARVAAEVWMWLPSLVIAAAVLTDLALYAGARAAVGDLSRDTARMVAAGTLPADLVPARMTADLPLGAQPVSVSTLAGDDVVMDFSVDVADATLFGMVALVSGGAIRARTTVHRAPDAVSWAGPAQ